MRSPEGSWRGLSTLHSRPLKQRMRHELTLRTLVVIGASSLLLLCWYLWNLVQGF